MPFVDQFKRRGKDLIENTGLVVDMLVDRLRNYNAGEVPMIVGGELKNKPLSDQQLFERDISTKQIPDSSEKGISDMVRSLRNRK